MARTYAKIMCSIWRDPDFVALDRDPQRVYLMLLSQADLTACGSLVWRPKRWARYAPSESVESVEGAIRRLCEAGMVMVDEDFDELWITSFLRYDGILNHPGMKKACLNAVEQLMSDPIRDAFWNAFENESGMGSEKSTVKDKDEGLGLGRDENRKRMAAAREALKAGNVIEFSPELAGEGA